jgi:hypothetical protein
MEPNITMGYRPTMKTNNQTQRDRSWEEEFDDFYYGKINTLADSELWLFIRSDEVKEFVKALLAQQREALIEEVENIGKDYVQDIDEDEHDEDREFCATCGTYFFEGEYICVCTEVNKVLKKLSAKLSELKEKE